MESEKKYGIETLKAAVDLGANIRIGFKNAMADGKFDPADTLQFAMPTVDLVKLLTKYKAVGQEFGDLDEEEKAQLAGYAKEKYKVEDGKEELFVNRCLKIAVELGDLIEDAVTGDAS